MPKRENAVGTPEVQETTKKSTVRKATDKLLSHVEGAVADILEVTERKVEVGAEGEKSMVDVCFVTFKSGRAMIKDVLYHFIALEKDKSLASYFIEIADNDQILMFYKDA